MMMHKINYYDNLLVVVTVGITDLEPVTLNPVYRSLSAVSGSLSVMATVEVLPVVRLRVGLFAAYDSALGGLEFTNSWLWGDRDPLGVGDRSACCYPWFQAVYAILIM